MSERVRLREAERELRELRQKVTFLEVHDEYLDRQLAAVS
jgi:hypothetical protein